MKIFLHWLKNLQRISIQDWNTIVCFCIYMDASWRIWSMDSKETFSRDAVHIIDLHLIIQMFQLLNWWNLHITCKNRATYKINGMHVKNWNRMQNAADFGGILSICWIRMYATYNFTTCVFFTKCEILVWNTWCIGTNFLRAVRNWYQFFMVWNLRSGKFEVWHGFMMATCFPSMAATQFGKFHFSRKPSASCVHSSVVEGAVITSSTYSSHMTLHTSLTTTERVFSGTHQEYCVSEYLVPETKWRIVAANLRPESKGSLYQVYCFTMRWRTLSSYISTTGIHRNFLKARGSSLLSSTMSWSWTPNCRRLSGFSHGLTQMLLGCSCPSSHSHSTSDKPVYSQLLLEDLLVGHSSNIMQFQALCIFHSGEGTTYYIAPGILLLKYSESFAKIRDAAFKFVSLRPKSYLIVKAA